MWLELSVGRILQFVSHGMKGAAPQQRLQRRGARRVFVHRMTGHAIFAEQPPAAQPLQQSVTRGAGGEGLPESDHDETCAGSRDRRDTFAKRIAPARRKGVVTPAVYVQVECCADVQ